MMPFHLKCIFLLVFMTGIEGMVSAQQLDPSFNNVGLKTLHFGEYNDVRDVIILPDGNALLAVNALEIKGSFFDTDIVLVKLKPDGNLASDFGVNGVLSFDFNEMDNSEAFDLALTSDQRILIAGRGNTDTSKSYLNGFVMALDLTGAIDSTFGTNGSLDVVFHGISETPTEILEDAQGNILVCGYSINPDDEYDNSPVIARYSPSGMIDSTFGSTGKLRLNSISFDLTSLKTSHVSGGGFYSMEQPNDSSYVLYGALSDMITLTSSLTYLNFDGQLDSTKGDEGIEYLYPTLDQNGIYRSVRGFADTTLLVIDDFGLNKGFTYGVVAEGETKTDIIYLPEHQARLTAVVPAQEGYYLIGKTVRDEHYSSASFSDQFSILKLSRQFSIDSTFGINGWAHFDFGDELACGASHAVQMNNGALFLAGRKYLSDGSYDAAFAMIDPSAIGSSIAPFDDQTPVTYIFRDGSIGALGARPDQIHIVYDLYGRQVAQFTGNSWAISKNITTGWYIIRSEKNAQQVYLDW